MREGHCNTLEGLWTGVRNFLRPFRGVSQWFLEQDVAVFQWGYNLKLIFYSNTASSFIAMTYVVFLD